MGLPAELAPAAASGGALNSAESDLAWSLLNELWDSEPDFFYEDVLAMTFYSDTTMDSVLAGGLFDDSGESGSFNDGEFFVNDFFDDSSFNGSAGNDFLDFEPEASSDFADSSFTSDFDVAGDEVADATDLLASAKSEVASWSQRLNAQPFAMPGAARGFADEGAMAAVVPVRFAATGEPVFVPVSRADVESSPRETAPRQVVPAARPIQESAVVSPETKTLDSFFSRFPSVLGLSAPRSSVLKLAQGDRGSSTDGDNNALPDSDAVNEPWSYSQWTSLLGVAAFSAASLWKTGATDRAESRSAQPFRTRSNGKRPAACRGLVLHGRAVSHFAIGVILRARSWCVVRT
jgi:hypothetical protein